LKLEGGSEKKNRRPLWQSIAKIQQSHRKSLTLSEDGHSYLEKLLHQFVISLITPSIPKNIQEAHEKIAQKVPEPLCTGLLEGLQENGEKSRKKPLMSVDKVQQIIKDHTSVAHVEKNVFIFFAAVLEYMLSDILKLTVSYIDNFSVTRTKLTEQDVKIAMFADKVLVNIFQNDETELDIPIIPTISKTDIGKCACNFVGGTQYDEC